ncbi:hypothetical protein J437_LFUL009114 [Ladona fulva]|uniref:Aquaporin n=1 Tax=Ladona fulva TaxID=123851 RepID=A0A8K0K9P0_LADFU|nr:hypothetical protein J437_LFUL009114 [Ladona fulva]
MKVSGCMFGMKGEMKGSFGDLVGLSDVTKSSIWKALVAEFVGTFFLVFVGCGSCVKGWTTEPSVLHIALCFGLTVAAMVQVTGHVSGGHINPAVSVSLVVSGQLTVLRCAFYVLVQCIGAVAGAALLRVVTPSEVEGGAIGLTSVSPSLTAEQGVLVEAIVTAVLVLVVHAVVDLSGKLHWKQYEPSPKLRASGFEQRLGQPLGILGRPISRWIAGSAPLQVRVNRRQRRSGLLRFLKRAHSSFKAAKRPSLFLSQFRY